VNGKERTLDMGKFNHYKHVLTPIKVGPLTLKNRIQFSPHANNFVTNSGEPTPEFIDYIEDEAKTGVGLLTVYATPVDRETGIDYDAEVDITTDKNIVALQRTTEAAHIHGAKISIELVHAGRGADPALISRDYALAPSNIPIPGQMQNIKVMDNADIQDVIAKYVDCALRAKRCGFDMVMIHAAHGNLIAQFLSPMTNFRNDIYGGSLENRMRFPLMLLKAVREAVGPDMAIEMRISGDEMCEEGMHIDEVIEFLKKAQEYIDLVNISAGIVVNWHASFYTMPPFYLPRGMNIPLARKVKQCPDIHIPVSVVGGLDSLEWVDQIIDEGSADIGVIARALIVDPLLIRKSLLGHPEQICPCIRCWGCAETMGMPIRCAANPAAGRTGKYKDPPKVLEKDRKKIVVVGGGTSGMQATRTLAERGHNVILLEKTDHLGGMLLNIDQLPFKSDLRKYAEWAVRATLACGAEIRLNTVATPELIEAESPDALFIATGSTPAKPQIPGIDGKNVVNVIDVDTKRVKVSGKIVVCGGGVSGCECGLALAMEGCDVTVVDLLPEEDFAKAGMAGITRNMLLWLLQDNKVVLKGNRKVTRITDKGIEVACRNWKTEFLEADYVVDAFGMQPTKGTVDALSDIVFDTYVVGDAYEANNIKSANTRAYTMACNV